MKDYFLCKITGDFSKSDFAYQIIDDVLCIKDLNLGKMSVTNNIENIIDYILKNDNDIGKLKKILVIYKDSENEWNEIRLNENKNFENFSYIGVIDMNIARDGVKNRRLKNSNNLLQTLATSKELH